MLFLKRLLVVTFLSLLTAFAACDDDAPTEPTGKLVGPEGGTFAFADSNVVLIIPPGALSDDVHISVEPALRYPESARVVAGTMYKLGPTGLSFLEPVELRIAYDENRLPPGAAEADLRLYRATFTVLQLVRGSGVWTGEVPPLVYGSIGRFGVFGIARLSATDGLSGSVSPDALTLAVGDVAKLAAHEEFRDGIGPPNAVTWTASDAGILRLVDQAGDSCVVEGLAPGEAFVIAVIDNEFVDTVSVTVRGADDIAPGDVRWRVEIGSNFWHSPPALDAEGNVFVVSHSTDELLAFRPDGTLRFDAPGSCFSLLGPSVTAEGSAYVAGICYYQAARHAPDGSILWQYPKEGHTIEGGLAVAPDGSAVLLYGMGLSSDILGVVLTKISSGGELVWRDTLSRYGMGNRQPKAPAIAANRDVYAWWFDAAGSWLSRVTEDGDVLWTVPAPDARSQMAHNSPAVKDDRVALGYYGGGLAVFDTSGAMLWDHTGPWGTGFSTPVFDSSGNIYVQSGNAGLRSYDPFGALRWSADSLNVYSPEGVGAPTLLSNGQLLAPCRDPSVSAYAASELCSVDASDGSLAWRTDLGATIHGSAAVAPDGTIYVLNNLYSSSSSGLIALWGEAPPLTEGWPTEGGGMGRLRRQQ
jgi:outer membrane protein assembly factor BamB